MKIELTAPRKYADMSVKELRFVAALMAAGQSEEQIRTKCFIRFTKITPIGNANGEIYYFVKRKLKGSFQLSVEEVADFSNQFRYITSNFVGLKPIAKIGKYKAVDRLLRDASFGQYLDIENYYQAYLYTKKEVYLTKLIAVLYLRKSYAETNLAKAEIYIQRKACAIDRMIVTMWMVGMKHELARKFKYLFKREEVNEDDDDVPTPPNMLELITNQVRMLTDGDITKNKQILNSNTWDALTELDNKCREYEELIRKSEQHV